jgi:septum formation protein
MRLGRLILASASPRRRELLAQAGLEFEVVPADIDEAMRDDEPANLYVQRLAREKAELVWQRRCGEDSESVPLCVLGADTTVVLDGEILGKPVDVADAERMLRQLSGRTHQVHTGIVLVGHGFVLQHVETTDVYFRDIWEEELAAYLASGDPMDKAGAYGIQGYAARWISQIKGDYFNVMGSPIAATMRLLAEAGLLPAHRVSYLR